MKNQLITVFGLFVLAIAFTPNAHAQQGRNSAAEQTAGQVLLVNTNHHNITEARRMLMQAFGDQLFGMLPTHEFAITIQGSADDAIAKVRGLLPNATTRTETRAEVDAIFRRAAEGN